MMLANGSVGSVALADRQGVAATIAAGTGTGVAIATAAAQLAGAGAGVGVAIATGAAQSVGAGAATGIATESASPQVSASGIASGVATTTAGPVVAAGGSGVGTAAASALSLPIFEFMGGGQGIPFAATNRLRNAPVAQRNIGRRAKRKLRQAERAERERIERETAERVSAPGPVTAHEAATLEVIGGPKPVVAAQQPPVADERFTLSPKPYTPPLGVEPEPHWLTDDDIDAIIYALAEV